MWHSLLRDVGFEKSHSSKWIELARISDSSRHYCCEDQSNQSVSVTNVKDSLLPAGGATASMCRAVVMRRPQRCAYEDAMHCLSPIQTTCGRDSPAHRSYVHSCVRRGAAPGQSASASASQCRQTAFLAGVRPRRGLLQRLGAPLLGVHPPDRPHAAYGPYRAPR